MKEYMEFSAKTVDEAITKALLELSISSDRLDYEVIEKGSSGFLGMFARPAVIRVAKPTESEDEYLLEMPKKKEKKEEAPKEDKVKEAPKSQKPQEKEAPKAPKNPVKETKEAPAKSQQSQKAPKAQKPQEKETVKAPKNNDKPYEKEGSRASKPQRDKKPQYKEGNKETAKVEKVKEAKPVVKEEPKEPVVLVKPTDEATLELLARVEKFLGEMFGAMNMAVTIETGYDAEEKTIIVNLSGDEMGVLIGKRGQTLIPSSICPAW